MSGICAADLHHLQVGKKLVLKSYQGSLTAPVAAPASENYWQLIGAKAQVAEPLVNGRLLIVFACDFRALGLASARQPNSLWVAASDVKLVCRPSA